MHRIGVWGRELDPQVRRERQALQLLQCYGIVTRESLRSWRSFASAQDKPEDTDGGLSWALLYRQFQLMEMRGEVRRGYFVEGLPGIQFALPEAVECLRTWTRPEAAGAGDLVLLNASDPANLFGPALPGVEAQEHDPGRFTRIPANYVVLLRGRPVLLLETGGERVTTLPGVANSSKAGLPPDTLRRALKLAVEHVGRAPRRLTLKEWNGEPILGSTAAPILEELGFRREALVYVWD